MEKKNLSADNLKQDEQSEPKRSYFMQQLYKSAIRNSKREKGNRYDSSLNLFCCYLFTIGGRLMYETLAANLPIPTVHSVTHKIRNIVCDMMEGVCRFKELKTFLLSRGLPLIVWLSEDATRITERVQYDSETNQLVGFVLPLSSNGMPKSDTFVVKSAAEIERNFLESKTSSLVYAIMAQPLQSNAPTFCLCLFGTDNKFDFKIVRRRWSFIRSGLEKEGISVLGISSDGDPRLLRAMQTEIQFNSNDSTKYYDFSGGKHEILYYHTLFSPKQYVHKT